MYPVKLRGRAITLREFRDDDVAGALAVVGDDRVTRWLSFDARSPAATADLVAGAIARSRLEPRGEYYLAVADAADVLVGFVRLGLAGVRAAKLGYAVRAADWGRGYATDACRTMLDFGFGPLGLHRVSAAVGPDNAASLAVVRKLGMRHEGRLRDHVHTNDAWRDSELFSILRAEWPGGPAAG
ncbi:hypothetical protein GCM10010123_16390 [Pilimelia anulata]|uniref:N-acetyltransferase domain-containing protein n=1 Tax=Pilimelia anulata TaxID=53371 RepID=A0A8J3B8L1_9ACTN|nr:GNAT family protein [Pilimelia anulata]GGJ87526.1 hypothetical protein GCM10010123_16390 [Pilimelia anulata]